MKRLHVSLAVDDLAASIRFYAALFGTAPTVSKPDYAKWLLDDPRVNLSLTARGRAPGLDHLGIQAETPAELAEVTGRLAAAGLPLSDQGAVTCCYAKSEKAWARDPQGISWEAFHSFAASDSFGDDAAEETASPAACCPPKPEADARCC